MITDREPNILRVVIQKPNSNGDRGRLNGPSVDALHDAGVNFEFEGRSMECFAVYQLDGQQVQLQMIARGNRNIVSYVAERNADAAIVGFDRYLDVEPRLKGRVRWDVNLGFAGCTFRLGVDDGTDGKSKADTERMRFINPLKVNGIIRPPTLEDVRSYLEDSEHPEHHREQFIATEHPNALILKANEERIELTRRNVAEYYNGVEGARRRDGLKYPFIADLTSSGVTMKDNGYVPQDKELPLFVSQAGLIRSTAIWSEEKEAIYEALRADLLYALEDPTKKDDGAVSRRNGHHNIFNRFPFGRSPTVSAIHNVSTAILILMAPFFTMGAKRK